MFRTARYPEKGKPINSWMRIYKKGRNYEIRITRKEAVLCTILSGNKIRFELSLENLLQGAHVIVGNLWKTLPIAIERKRKGVYHISGTQTEVVKELGYLGVLAHGQEYRKGITFDMVTGECLNPEAPIADRVIPEMRSAWLSDLRRFKRGIKARAKVGALDGYVAKMIAHRGADIRKWWVMVYDVRGRWADHNFQQHLVECMKENKYPADVLEQFVGTTIIGWREEAEPYAKHIICNVDSVFRDLSLELRKVYGVFGRR